MNRLNFSVDESGGSRLYVPLDEQFMVGEGCYMPVAADYPVSDGCRLCAFGYSKRTNVCARMACQKYDRLDETPVWFKEGANDTNG
jgi:hypothetical protein